jgi:hypothetical protein
MNDCFEIDLLLKADGTASFVSALKHKKVLGKLYPDLLNFQGNWMEAYVFLSKMLNEYFKGNFKFPKE